MYPIKIALRGCNDLEDLNNFIKSENIKMILFGETHGMINDLQVQEQILEKVSSDFYLYELLEEYKLTTGDDFEKFLEKPEEEDFSVISSFGDLKPTVNLARKFNLKVVGCDVKNMFRKDKSFLEKKDLTEEETKIEEEIMRKREMRQKNIIEKYISKTDKVVFASVGLYHIRKESFLIQNLEEDFLIVYPVNEKGEKLWEAEDFDPENVSYIITSKENYLQE